MQGIVSYKGRIFKPEDAGLPFFDRGLLFGDRVGEILRVKNGKLIDFMAHFQRLSQTLEACLIPLPWQKEELRFQAESLVQQAGFSDAALRIWISRGAATQLLPQAQTEPHWFLACEPYQEPEPSLYQKGLSLKTESHPAPSQEAQWKHGFYLPGTVRALHAQKEGFDDILWINRDAELMETLSANIFLISREGDRVEIATPPLKAGILPGITRARVIELLHRSQIPVLERSFSLEELPRSDEAFVTSSLRGPFPIQRIDRHRLHSTRPQAVFQHILRLYRSWEELEGGDLPESGTPTLLS